MRDFATCFSEYAIQVSDNTSCSSNSSYSCISPIPNPTVQNAVVSLYRALHPSHKQILITLTWCRNSSGGSSFSITFGPPDHNSAPPAVKLNTNSRFFRKPKGSKSIEHQSLEIEVLWDLSEARYESGPEPVDGYYILISIDSQLCLILGGEMAEEAAVKKVKSESGLKSGSAALLSRQEHFSGSTVFSTRTRFSESGTWHDIVIRFRGEPDGLKQEVLSVSVDKKPAVRVKRVQWNFRGNQTIFVDGLLVDLMWNVHDWFCSGGSGIGVFMFRTRTGLDSRLWMEDTIQDKIAFSLVIYACKNL